MPVLDRMLVPLSKPDITQREIELVVSVLKSGQLSLGPRVVEFEEQFASFVGARHAIATSSGTAALHLCVRGFGIGSEEEVLTTSFSFVASANCLLYERALPIFLDIDPQTLNIDPREIERFLEQRCLRNGHGGRLIDKLTGRTVKAILPVHVFGLPCDMGCILPLARDYGLDVLEDACEALGAECNGRRVGTFGRAACFAFYPNKQVTTGEGGMIVTNDHSLAKLCRSLRNQGRDEGCSWLRHQRLGYNYRLSDVHCALGLAQLERVDDLLSARETVAAAYHRGLARLPGVVLPFTPPGLKRSWFVYVIRLDGKFDKRLRDNVMTQLRERGIGCQAYFPPIHRQPYYRQFSASCFGSLPHTVAASHQCLALPFFSGAAEPQVRYVCEALAEILPKQVCRAA